MNARLQQQLRRLSRPEREAIRPYLEEFSEEQRHVFATLYLSGRRLERIIGIPLRKNIEHNRRFAEECAALSRRPPGSAIVSY